MPRKNKIPSYRLHRQSGQGIVTLPDGFGGRKDVLLGTFDTPESRERYGRVIAEWQANYQQPVQTGNFSCSITINELILLYWKHVEVYYVKDGEPTSEQDNIRQALRFLKQLYGFTAAQEFGPLALKAVRQAMIDHKVVKKYRAKDERTGEVVEQTKVLAHGLVRTHINKHVSRIRQMFRWATENEILPVATYQALATVAGLRKGRSEAREKPKIQPVADETRAIQRLRMPILVKSSTT
ncbi:MAG: hypothetical protein ACFCD0_26830 [Gemmataceae bacterium]